MLHDVEDIRDAWTSTGLLKGCPDTFNCALLLETQCRISKKTNAVHQFKLCSVTAMLQVCKHHPDMFQGLMDSQECCDVYRLGPVPKGTNAEVCLSIVRRVINLEMTGLYFGGIVSQRGKMYLLADWIN